MILERNEKPITGGALVFRDRLEIFLTDTAKHSPIFDQYVRGNDIHLSDVCKMKQTDLENLATLTSSRGVAKRGISLSEKDIVM